MPAEANSPRLGLVLRGAGGRMGLEVERAVADEGSFEIRARPKRGEDLLSLAAEKDSEVFLDLTEPSALGDLDRLVDRGVRLVVGTSGVGEERLECWSRACAESGSTVLVIPNFCLGVVLLQRFSAWAAVHFPEVEICEMHHEGKKDSPSGTAADTARRIRRVRGDRGPAGEDPFRGGFVHGIPIHSVRLPGFLAHQICWFGGAGEILTIRHDVRDRKAFMPGVLAALHAAFRLEGLHVGLEHCLEGLPPPPGEGG